MDEKINLKQFLTESTRKKEKIEMDGYAYNFKEVNDTKLIWRCNKRGCPGGLHTDAEYNLVLQKTHTHQRNIGLQKKKQLKEAIIARSLETRESSRDIVLNLLPQEEFNNEIYSVKYLQEVISKVRKINNYSFDSDYDIPNELMKTLNGVDFLLHDSGMECKDRCIIFSTASDIIHLFNGDTWIIDGTFKVCPAGFSQLITIQALVRGKYCALVFCVMKRKNLESYITFLTILRNMHPVKQPLNIVFDFEPGFYSSLHAVFPSSNLNGCLFHLSQIFWRKIQSSELSVVYNETKNVRFFVKLILALAFIPVYELEVYVSRLKDYYLRESAPEFIFPLLEWFYCNFISNASKNHRPIFWSVYDRVMNKKPRTTNSLEGYHRHLNNICETKHPSISSLVKELRNEQFLTSQFILTSHVKFYTKPENVEIDEIEEIVRHFNDYYDIEFLKAIVMNFNFPLDI